MLAARDLIAEDFLKTRRAHIDNGKRMVYYLSMEFLLGRAFVNALINEGVYAEFEEAFKQRSPRLVLRRPPRREGAVLTPENRTCTGSLRRRPVPGGDPLIEDRKSVV